MADPLKIVKPLETVRASRDEIELTTPDYEAMERWRRKPRDLLLGLDRIKAQSGNGMRSSADVGSHPDAAGDASPGAMHLNAPYLPKNEAEELAQYKFRRDHLTVLDPDLDDAIDGVVGAMLPKPITLETGEMTEEQQATVEAWQRNVDRNGRSLDAFLKAVESDAQAEGLSYVFVDADPTGAPYLAHWKGANVPYVKLARDAASGRMVVGEVRVVEQRTVEGEEQTVWRIYRRGNPAVPPAAVQRESIAAAQREGQPLPPGAARYVSFEFWRKDESENATDDLRYERIRSGVMLPPNGQADNPDFVEVPIYPVSAGLIRPHFAKPRWLKLAELCILKLVKLSNLEAYLYWTGSPLDFIKGLTRKQFEQANEGDAVIGGGHLNFGGGSADVDWQKIEPTGQAAKAQQESLDRLQGRIDKAAAAVMTSRATGAELKATAILANENRRATRLDVDAAMLASALGMVLGRVGAYWNGLEIPYTMPPTDPSRIADPVQARAFVELLVREGKLSTMTAIEEGQRRGWLTTEIDPAEEAQRVADEVAM